MTNRESVIDKLEAWARWEIGETGETVLPGEGRAAGAGFLPGDQADHLTVEVALREFEETRQSPRGLRELLLHIYGCDSVPESFDPLLVSVPEGRGFVRSFLRSFGWRPESFARACVSRFLRFLGRRLEAMDNQK